MHYPALKKYVNKYKKFKPLILGLDNYIYEVSQKPKGNNHFTPSLLAIKLDIEKITALSLLGMAHKAGILIPVYVAYSPDPDNFFLGEFYSKDKIPDVIDCSENGEKYSKDEFYIDLIFKFKKLEKFFSELSPSELARIRGRMQEASTRDKKRLIKKVIEIEKIVNGLGFSISLIQRKDER